MKSIYLETNLFWVASKFIFTFLLIIFPGYVLMQGGLQTEELLYNFILFLEGILLAITLKDSFSLTSDLSNLRKLSGSVLVLFGIGLIIFLSTLSKGSRNDYYELGFLLALWILLLGIYDVLGIKKIENK